MDVPRTGARFQIADRSTLHRAVVDGSEVAGRKHMERPRMAELLMLMIAAYAERFCALMIITEVLSPG